MRNAQCVQFSTLQFVNWELESLIVLIELWALRITGGMRRVHLRGHTNILKRLVIYSQRELSTAGRGYDLFHGALDQCQAWCLKRPSWRSLL